MPRCGRLPHPDRLTCRSPHARASRSQILGTMPKMRVTGQGWNPALLSSAALFLGVALCGAGVAWDRLLAPGMDDSDPSTYIGSGLLLFGVPAAVLALMGVAARTLSRTWAVRMSFGLGLTAF